MHTAQKHGFSLIELMVVIVIMGVLAAVAVPKLFGLMAKSKASELVISASTYIKLQDAYNIINEKQIGSWSSIGYEQKSNSNFKYFEGNSENGDPAKSSVEVTDGKIGGWKSVSVGALNGCKAQSIWRIDLSASSTDRLIYSVKITGGATGECAALSASFDKLATDGQGIGTP